MGTRHIPLDGTPMRIQGQRSVVNPPTTLCLGGEIHMDLGRIWTEITDLSSRANHKSQEGTTNFMEMEY